MKLDFHLALFKNLLAHDAIGSKEGSNFQDFPRGTFSLSFFDLLENYFVPSFGFRFFFFDYSSRLCPNRTLFLGRN